MLFRLNEKHIRERRLFDEDFSAVAGFPVKTFELSSFKHWGELQKNGILPQDKLRERADNIFSALQKAGLTHPDGPFERKDADSIDAEKNASVIPRSDRWDYCDTPVFRHFDLIRQHGFQAAHNNSDIWIETRLIAGPSAGRTVRSVFPGALNEDIGVTKLGRKHAAFVLVDHRRTALQYWSDATYICKALVIHTPKDNMHGLEGDLHEQRHLQQIFYKSRVPMSGFYTELDADMYARSVMRQADIGKQTAEASLHARYIGMFYSALEYAFIATIEALENGQEPKNFFATICAVAEIKIRIMMQHQKIDHKQYTSRHIQDCIAIVANYPSPQNSDDTSGKYFEGFVDDFRSFATQAKSDPSDMYTALRQVLDSKSITDPFAEMLATKILAAASYFNPDLPYGDRKPSERRIDDALRAGNPNTRNKFVRGFRFVTQKIGLG